MARERQAGPAHLAAGGAEGPTEATDASGQRLWLNDGSCIRLRPCWPNHVWSYDFVMDRTHDGRKFRMLTVIDEFTRRCMAVVVRAKIELGQCTPLSDRALRPTWLAGSYPFRQRRQRSLSRRDWLGPGSASRPSISSQRVTLGERIQRALQLKAPGRNPEHGDLLYS